MSEKSSPGRESLVYHPSKVSWATAEFLARPPAWVSRLFIYLLVAFLIVGAAYSHFSQIALSIEAPGALLSQKPVIPIQAPIGFRVEKVFVTENQKVDKGTVLLASEEQLTFDEFKRIQEETKTLLALLESMTAGRCVGCSSRLTELSESVFEVDSKGSIRDTLAPLQNLLRDLATLENQYANINEVMSVQLRQIRLSRQKLKEVRRRRAEKILAMQVEQLNNEIIAAKAQIADRKQTLLSQIEQARNKLEVQLTNLEATVELYRSQHWLVAPADAVVTQLKVSGPGQIISTGQEVMQLVPLNTELEAELLVANRDISRIKPNMNVKIRLDALPDREFGPVRGTIRTVPVNVSVTQDPGAPSTYRVRATLSRQSFTKGKTEYPFRLGMTLTGLIITDHQSLLRIGLRKLLKIKDDLFKG